MYIAFIKLNTWDFSGYFVVKYLGYLSNELGISKSRKWQHWHDEDIRSPKSFPIKIKTLYIREGTEFGLFLLKYETYVW